MSDPKFTQYKNSDNENQIIPNYQMFSLKNRQEENWNKRDREEFLFN